MKKVVVFILSIILSFSPFVGASIAAGLVEPQITPQAFGDNLLATARQLVGDPNWEGLHEDSRHWAEIAADQARRAGLSPHVCIITFHNAETYWAITLEQDGRTFICDYYKILYELSERHLPNLSRPWQCIEFEEYIYVNRVDTGRIFESMLSFSN